mmetsp:Transcript_32411/g.53650  ORF Transcript_32411/g.53650 Transcript_32411/m.53650 type:complete len:119 (+) Transcript_32411:145-501(+)
MAPEIDSELIMVISSIGKHTQTLDALIAVGRLAAGLAGTHTDKHLWRPRYQRIMSARRAQHHRNNLQRQHQDTRHSVLTFNMSIPEAQDSPTFLHAMLSNAATLSEFVRNPDYMPSRS